MPVLIAVGAFLLWLIESGKDMPVVREGPAGPEIVPEDEQDAYTFIQYTVKSGDTLSSIARQFLGTESLWPLIWDMNRSRIGSNPDQLRGGTALTFLESGYTQEQLDLAVERASAHHLAWAKWSTTRVPSGGPVLNSFILTGAA